jgi:hypothetical protein
LWDFVAIVLSIGGLALSVTTIVPALRRLRRRATLLATGIASVTIRPLRGPRDSSSARVS